MLHIYIGKDNLPKNMNLVFDVNALFSTIDLQDTDWTRFVFSNVEQAKYLDVDRFYDRFEKPLQKDFLSSGTKFLLLLEYCQDCIINATEAGINALGCVMYADFGYCYFLENYHHTLSGGYPDRAYSVNGTTYIGNVDAIEAFESYGE